MANTLKYYIKILFFIIFLFSNSEENIIENPKLIISKIHNPIIFNGKNEYYNIITPGKIYTMEKLTRQKISEKDSDFYTSPYFLCIDETNNYFLYANKEYYNITLNSNLQIINLNKGQPITTDSNIEFIGCLKESQYNDQGNNINIEKNEIINYEKN